MDLEKLLRANLDPANQAGRPLQEYRLRVTQVGGALVARIHPEGFNAQEEIYEIQANLVMPTTEAILEGLHAQEAAAQLEFDRARDRAVQAAAEMKKGEDAIAEAKARDEAAAAAALARPVDISKGTVVEP